MEPLEGIAAADAHLGRRVPLPTVALPLARWVEVCSDGPGAVEVEWNLDDTRGGPGRLALLASRDEPDSQLAGEPDADGWRTAALEEAQPSLRPARERIWRHEDLWLRLTAQGPWDAAQLTALLHSISG